MNSPTTLKSGLLHIALFRGHSFQQHITQLFIIQDHQDLRCNRRRSKSIHGFNFQIIILSNGFYMIFQMQNCGLKRENRLARLMNVNFLAKF